ncbi:type II toxin-antitoxin system RatA family toxin [Nocardiopsis sp. L17-MgMaSL7]|uniref:type II toxin-antitoxin system RatA family toxin n=1 Tax=Nocardiopsis sp. L17-MgMaSL7 TaxID=1938893 RepID=UPI000D71D2F3|nr:SRPBCC family protein [Nocardiopsis sp. L17-MgMaSL7]PWV58093.1 ribosome-associated toxin RatA of RatAB toxin-antitoxin module [Nocardiopsis sp. L17-MgMaSL7]
MQKVSIEAVIKDRSPEEVFDVVSDFGRYPDLVDTVRAVTVRQDSDGQRAVSDWEVYFRNGVLSWTEGDVLDRSALTISFEQVAGDFDVFTGEWRMAVSDANTRLSFIAEFDFGVPSLSTIIDPVAVRVLTETMETILMGLFENEVVFEHQPSQELAHLLSGAR